MQNKTVKRQSLDFGFHFDVTKHIRLVPPFQENEADKYFLHFKKSSKKFKMAKGALELAFAKRYNWEAQEIYTQLNVEQSSSYETVLEISYEIVIEIEIV